MMFIGDYKKIFELENSGELDKLLRYKEFEHGIKGYRKGEAATKPAQTSTSSGNSNLSTSQSNKSGGGASTPAASKFCASCGATRKPGDKFCNSCGSKFE